MIRLLPLFSIACIFGSDKQDDTGSPAEEEGPVADIHISCADATCLTYRFDGTTSTGDGLSFSWELPDGSSSTQPYVDVKMTEGATYEALLKVQDGEGSQAQYRVVGWVPDVEDPSGEAEYITDPDYTGFDGKSCRVRISSIAGCLTSGVARMTMTANSRNSGALSTYDASISSNNVTAWGVVEGSAWRFGGGASRTGCASNGTPIVCPVNGLSRFQIPTGGLLQGDAHLGITIPSADAVQFTFTKLDASGGAMSVQRPTRTITCDQTSPTTANITVTYP